MMDLATLNYLSKKAGKTAKANGKAPFVFKAGDVTVDNLKKIPNLGTYLPKGWARVSLQPEADDHGVYMGDNNGFGAYFVDASGFGGPGEPALTLDELVAKLKPGLGYGIVEVGQFQIKIGAFAVRTDG